MKWNAPTSRIGRRRLPPYGGSGLKFAEWLFQNVIIKSPSIRREWIEIMFRRPELLKLKMSPSIRREWIEIVRKIIFRRCQICLPPYGGSGLKYGNLYNRVRKLSLPPYGGSGLKFDIVNVCQQGCMSPSIRREWIEIQCPELRVSMPLSLPPYGGSGLKCPYDDRRTLRVPVSLHTEGVD